MEQKETTVSQKGPGCAWRAAEKIEKIFSQKGPENYPIYAVNNGKNMLMKMIPDPPSIPLSTHMMYDSSAEPKFDPKVHVELVAPKNIAIFDEGSDEDFKSKPFGEYKCIPSNKGCDFAYSDPFQFLSNEGSRVAREILTAMKIVPWTTEDTLVSEEFGICHHFSETYCFVTRFYIGKVGAEGPVDQWHFDFVNYAAITLLSDINDMKVSSKVKLRSLTFDFLRVELSN